MLIEEDISLLEHRLTSTQTYSSSNLIYRMLNDIDLTLKNQSAIAQVSQNHHSLQNDNERLKLLKNDIIQQAIITSRKLANNLNKDIQTDQRKFSVKNRFIESTWEWQRMVLNAIETRRNHMIKRANFLLKHTLATHC